MRIYCSYSESHAELARQWFSTCRVDALIQPVLRKINLPAGNGDYANQHWKAINREGSEAMLEIIRQNQGSIIGCSGADVVYLRPFTVEIEGLMKGHDVLYQSEHRQGNMFNPDVSFYRCEERMIAGWMRWIERLASWDGHLATQNHLLREAFTGLSIGLLPHRYASTCNGGIVENPVLFHANWTPADDNGGSVEKKSRCLRGILNGFAGK